MDIREMLEKCKPFAPVVSAAVVAACVAGSLYGYKVPVYETKASVEDTQEQEDEVPVVKTSTEEETKEDEAAEEEEQAKGSFDLEDGVYQGSGTGYRGNITVAVTIKDKQITSIEILSASDDEPFFGRAKGLIDQIIKKQSTKVDTVSGATYSSKGIISAVKNALTGEKDSGTTGSSQEGTSASQSQSTPETVGSVQEPAAYKDGTYYGTGTGFGGTLKVKVVISGGKIASVEVVENHDDSSYLNRAKALIGNIISSQSTNVDVISGATYSSNGIKSAVRDALRQAAVSGNSQSVNTKTEDTSKTEDNTTVKGNFPYKEGIYYGTAEGYNGEIEVAVVLQDKSIKAVLVTKNHDDEKFFNRAMDVVKNIMKKQSTDVDVVSGATYSSNGLINAVKNALKEAEKVTNGQTTEPDKEKADTSELEKVMKEAEELKQEDYTEATYAVLKTRMEDAQKLLDTDKTEISQEDVDQALENLNQALALLEKKDDGEDDTTVYKNGIYEGRALCRPDEDEDFTAYNLTLKVTVRDDKIVAVTDVKGDGDSSNDRYILRAANGTSSKKGVTSQLIEKGNTEGIDAVSGATCTSKAILDACENALLSAKRQ